jgi:hypothetical protein
MRQRAASLPVQRHSLNNWAVALDSACQPVVVFRAAGLPSAAEAHDAAVPSAHDKANTPLYTGAGRPRYTCTTQPQQPQPRSLYDWPVALHSACQPVVVLRAAGLPSAAEGNGSRHATVVVNDSPGCGQTLLAPHNAKTCNSGNMHALKSSFTPCATSLTL